MLCKNNMAFIGPETITSFTHNLNLTLFPDKLKMDHCLGWESTAILEKQLLEAGCSTMQYFSGCLVE